MSDDKASSSNNKKPGGSGSNPNPNPVKVAESTELLFQNPSLTMNRRNPSSTANSMNSLNYSEAESENESELETHGADPRNITTWVPSSSLSTVGILGRNFAHTTLPKPSDFGFSVDRGTSPLAPTGTKEDEAGPSGSKNGPGPGPSH